MTTPRWEREAPLTAEKAAKMYRTARSFYVTAVAVFWALCAATAVIVPEPALMGGLLVFALLDAGAMWLAFRGARAGIRRNTVP